MDPTCVSAAPCFKKLTGSNASGEKISKCRDLEKFAYEKVDGCFKEKGLNVGALKKKKERNPKCTLKVALRILYY